MLSVVNQNVGMRHMTVGWQKTNNAYKQYQQEVKM